MKAFTCTLVAILTMVWPSAAVVALEDPRGARTRARCRAHLAAGRRRRQHLAGSHRVTSEQQVPALHVEHTGARDRPLGGGGEWQWPPGDAGALERDPTVRLACGSELHFVVPLWHGKPL